MGILHFKYTHFRAYRRGYEYGTPDHLKSKTVAPAFLEENHLQAPIRCNLSTAHHDLGHKIPLVHAFTPEVSHTEVGVFYNRQKHDIFRKNIFHF